MKTILFVRSLDNEEARAKIEEALSETRVDYTISLASRAVIVEGRNDLVHAAKTAIREAGYTVE